MQKIGRSLALCLLLFSWMALNGCGFHLRGTQKPGAITQLKEVVLLPYEPYSRFYQLLRENLKRSGVDVTLPEAHLTCPTLKVMKTEATQYSLVYSLQGQTRRERLQTTLNYELTLPYHTQSFNQKMTSNRDRQLNPNQDLADQYEKTLLENEMQQDLIEQLLQQLSFLPLNEPYRCVSTSTNSTP